MIVRFLGTHHEISKDTKLVSFLVDDILAVDAGSLASELSFKEQEKIKAILLSHGHYDHIRGIPSFIFSNMTRTTKVYGSEQTLKILTSNLFDGIIYPKFTEKIPFLEKPPIKLMPLKPYETANIEGYRVLALPVNHNEGSMGFEITSKDGKKIFFTGDTGPNLANLWKYASPHLLIIDVTFPNRLDKMASDAAHLCPKMLKEELVEFYQTKGYFPQVILIHLNPKYEREIKEEIKEVSRDLKIPIGIANEGDKISVQKICITEKEL